MVEAGELAHFRLVEAEQGAHFGHHLGWQPAELALRHIQGRAQRGPGHGITGLQGPDFSYCLFGKHKVLRGVRPWQRDGCLPLPIYVAQHDVD